MSHRNYRHAFFAIHPYQKRFIEPDMPEKFTFFNNLLFFNLFPRNCCRIRTLNNREVTNMHGRNIMKKMRSQLGGQLEIRQTDFNDNFCI